MKRNKVLNAFPFQTWIIFISAFFVRWWYVLYTNVYYHNHDLNVFVSGESGHGGYIAYLIDHHVLPNFDPTTMWSFCHPPLHHCISATWVEIMTNVFGVDYDEACESIQALTLLYGCLLVIIAYNIFEHLNLKGTALYVATAIVAFHPTFIYLSGSVNNDMLSVLLSAAAVLMCLKWYRYRKMKHIIACAVYLGLGMMTKLTVVVVAVPIAALFIVVLIKSIKEKKWIKTIAQYGVFGIISVPLGLWFPIYNNIRWGVPLGYVDKLDDFIPQYLGNESFVSRIFDFSPTQFASIFEQWFDPNNPDKLINYNEHNPLIAGFKTSIFGEYVGEDYFNEMPVFKSFAGMLFWSALILAGVGLVSMVILLIKKKYTSDMMDMIFIVTFYAAMMIVYYVNCARFPFVCTQNFRYIPLTVLTGAACVGMVLTRFKEHQKNDFDLNNLSSNSKKKFFIHRGIYDTIIGITIVYSVSSVIYTFGLVHFA